MTTAEINSVPAAETRGKSLLRPLGVAVSVGLLCGSFYSFRQYAYAGHAWALLGAALLVSILCQRGLELPGTAVMAPPEAPGRWRFVLGAALALCGAYFWSTAAVALYRHWGESFDRTWITWLASALV